ncbi:uncharacterized protein [Primulina eburnea]|uniref:uncharacterized protein n=1 Tax=Primulina eburnea TaxID=1245227 RepID=UPI003C6C107D
MEFTPPTMGNISVPSISGNSSVPSISGNISIPNSMIFVAFGKTPEFKFQAESPVAPVWARLPELPLHLYEEKSLCAIAKLLGKPIKVDDHTAEVSHGAYARVCVEINVLEPPVKHIWVGWGDHTQEIEVVYERIPAYCTDCKMLGHATSVCYSHGKNPRPIRAKSFGPVPPSQKAASGQSPQEGVISGDAQGPQDLNAESFVGPKLRRRRRPARRVPPAAVPPLEQAPSQSKSTSNAFDVLSPWQQEAQLFDSRALVGSTSEFGRRFADVGVDITGGPPSEHAPSGGVDTVGLSSPSVVVSPLALGGVSAQSVAKDLEEEDVTPFVDCVEVLGSPHAGIDTVFSGPVICLENHSCHSIPSDPPSPADASSLFTQLVDRQGFSVSERVVCERIVEDLDQVFDRHSEPGDGRASEDGVLDSDMPDVKKNRGRDDPPGSLRKRSGISAAYVIILSVGTSSLPCFMSSLFWVLGWLVGISMLFVMRLSVWAPVVVGCYPVEEFNTFIMDSGLIDAGFEGSSFTWTNKTIWKRLDRVMVSVDWGDHFSSIRVEHLPRTVYVHCPLLVFAPVFARGPSSFRFQRMWLRHHGFLQTVRLNWNLPCSLNGMSPLFVKLKRLKNHLKWWNRDVFGNIFDKITEAESAVRSAELACEADPSDSNWTALSDRNADLARVTAMEADFWKQKAACNWLEDGERNTKLFHNMVKKKRVANKIFRIWDDGVCLTSPDMIQQSGASFFQHLLTGDPFVFDCPDFLGFPSVISDEENYGITALPSLEEVPATVFSISPDSVAGPDGFSSAFFQHCWEIVHQDVLDAVLDFFIGSPLRQSFTATTITLIPKVKGARAWSDFHPISLCNVTNKIISKLLYSRLRAVAERLISLNQSGFVPGRMISDNILLAQELTHSLTLPTRGGNVILKLDMAKAYDRVQWPFLFAVLRHFGFSEQVVALVSVCISHCHFSVNINGSLSGFFGSTRGLRQGDPLSPLLFILRAVYLSRGLDRLYLRHPAIRYRSSCDLLIFHLAYADVIIIFANGGSRGMQRLLDFLHHYENCSGQMVNAVKGSLILSP